MRNSERRCAQPQAAARTHWVRHSPRLRALRVAAPTPSPGATPAARPSRFRGVSRRGPPFRRRGGATTAAPWRSSRPWRPCRPPPPSPSARAAACAGRRP
ncbi:hypothetical protein EJO70_13975 [Variovorax sp. 553]|nr:hypothetical protein EJO70_13975 [Variovorax sp. 553]RSZ42096.1 hypothetical protein EJO71_15065 [Variovorax sp. 679]